MPATTDGGAATPDAAASDADGAAVDLDASAGTLDGSSDGSDARFAVPEDAGGSPDAGVDLSQVCACTDGGALGECPIQALQDPAHPCFAGARAGLVVEDVVVTTPMAGSGFWIGEPGGGPYSGIFAFVRAGLSLPYVTVGDVVTVTGTTSEFYDRTQLTVATLDVTGSAAVPAPAEVAASDVCFDCAAAERWEGVLVRVHDVQVAQDDVGFGEWSVAAAGGGPEVRVDDLYSGWYDYRHGPADAFSTLGGVLDYTFGAYKLEPRRCADFVDPAGQPYCSDPVCPSGPVSVAQVHDTRRADAVPDRCFVWLTEGVVTSPLFPGNPSAGDFFFLQQGTSPHDGLRLFTGTAGAAGLVEGARVEAYGLVLNFPQSRVLLLKAARLNGTGAVPSPILLSPAEAGGHVPGAWGWDGMLVQVQDVVTVATVDEPAFGGDSGAFHVAKPESPADGAIVWDLLAGFSCPWPRPQQKCATDQRALGQRFASVTGNLSYSGEVYLLPRKGADLALAACDALDPDCDGVVTAADACPAAFDPGQADADGDAAGDADDDGMGDECDLCPSAPDPGQENLDGDLLGDACDPDRDGDGVDEGDGTSPCAGGRATGCQDDCPFVANPDQADADGDGRGDACEGGRAPIALDGLTEDWAALAPAHVDPRGDSGPGGLDFGGLWMADDGEFLYLRVDLGREVPPQGGQDLRVYLDTDHDAATGLAVRGIGAELEWRPGSRAGAFYTGASSTALDAATVGAMLAPTVSATEFELAFALAARPDGTTPAFPGSQVRVALADGADGDRLPDAPGGVPHQLGLGAPVAPAAVDLSRQSAADVRVASCNVHENAWTADGAPRFARLLAATGPDVLLLQEAAVATEAGAVAQASAALPGTWHARKAGGLLVLSRFPVLGSWASPSSKALVALLDVPAPQGGPLAAASVYLTCCENVAERRFDADMLLSTVRALRESGDLPAGTPLVLAGDFNLVDVAATREAILRGQVWDEAYFGADLDPDSGAPFVSLLAYQAGTRRALTWRGSRSFAPGWLDYVVYTGSSLEAGNRFVLDTARLSAAQLASLGLSADDSAFSDHALRVSDFRRR